MMPRFRISPYNLIRITAQQDLLSCCEIHLIVDTEPGKGSRVCTCNVAQPAVAVKRDVLCASIGHASAETVRGILSSLRTNLMSLEVSHVRLQSEHGAVLRDLVAEEGVALGFRKSANCLAGSATRALLRLKPYRARLVALPNATAVAL